MRIIAASFLENLVKPIIIAIGILFLVSCAAPGTTTTSTESAMPQGKDLVLETQQMLAERDYDPGPADGIMGGRTAAAIRAFQTDNNLEPTGKIDRATYTSLKSTEP